MNNSNGFRKVLDLVLMVSIILLILHFYFFCYTAFKEWGFVSMISDRILMNIARTGIFDHLNTTKWWSLGLLLLSVAGDRGRPMQRLSYYPPIVFTAIGLIFYFASFWLLDMFADPIALTIVYTGVTSLGYAFIIFGLSLFSRIIHARLKTDTFNSFNESFEQEQRCIKRADYVNLPTRFLVKGRHRKGWINIPSFRHLLVLGQPGSGKTWYILRNVIRQQLEQGFCMVVVDYKYPDLTKWTYNYFLRYKRNFAVPPKFFSLYFADVRYSHCCNPLHVSYILAKTDAADAARSALLGLNKSWIEKEGDYWSESAMSFMTALIWYLRKYKDGIYCSFPHVIELAGVEYGKLFSILSAEPDIWNDISSFVSAYINGSDETLDGQISSFRIAISRLSSPEIYYIMSQNDFTLDINNPQAPKILSIGNTPQRSGIYGSVISLYLSTINKLINKEGQAKSSSIYEELDTYYVYKLNEILATGRSNKVAVTLCVQNFDQLRFKYGRRQADVIVNLPASVIAGQVGGDSAKHVSDLIGRNVQDKESLQINRNDTSISRSTALDLAVPPSKIAQLSAGEVVGIVGDIPEEPVKLKAFHGHIDQDNSAINKVESTFRDLPRIRETSAAEVIANFGLVKQQVAALVDSEMERMQKTEELAHLIIARNS